MNCLGHNPQPVVEALEQQAKQLINPSLAFFYNQAMIDLAKRLYVRLLVLIKFSLLIVAPRLMKARLLARKWGQKHRNGAYKIISFEHGFHGRTSNDVLIGQGGAGDTLFAP